MDSPVYAPSRTTLKVSKKGQVLSTAIHAKGHRHSGRPVHNPTVQGPWANTSPTLPRVNVGRCSRWSSELLPSCLRQFTPGQLWHVADHHQCLIVVSRNKGFDVNTLGVLKILLLQEDLSVRTHVVRGGET